MRCWTANEYRVILQEKMNVVARIVAVIDCDVLLGDDVCAKK
jgi:hypothetical protein